MAVETFVAAVVAMEKKSRMESVRIEGEDVTSVRD
jgi:hypothetical protein